ncbi:DUF2254 family protein [Flavobacterium sp. GNP001]
MMYHSMKYRLKNIFIHQLKDVGTFLGVLYVVVIGSAVMLLEKNVDFGQILHLDIRATYESLLSVTNILVSILIGISLTTFSVIFVVMQLASSQFSPRILRHFLITDFKMQKFIGLIVGSISLCILPQLVTVFFPETPFLVTLSLGTLLAFYGLSWSYPNMITYLSINMNVSSITNSIKVDMMAEINLLYQENWKKGSSLLYKRAWINSNKYKIQILSPFDSGYLDSVNYVKLKTIVDVLKDSDLGECFENAYQKPIIGEFIMKETTTLVTLVFNQPLTETQAQAVQRKVSAVVKSAFKVEQFRSHTQDINFGVRKLVDIAIKAISPAVNDPTTCLNCIDQIGEIAKELALKSFPSTDARALSTAKIQVNEFDFEEFIDFCFDQIFQWGKEDPTVVKRILRAIRSIIPLVENPFHLKVLIQQVEEMELSTLYNLENYQTGALKISKEKLVTIENELLHFKNKAKRQIASIDRAGILSFYENEFIPQNEVIAMAQQQALHYLRQYTS